MLMVYSLASVKVILGSKLRWELADPFREQAHLVEGRWGTHK
jgi:hypothetical protein